MNVKDNEETLFLHHILISTFVKEPTVEFRCSGESVEDPNGKLYTIYTEEGITYIIRGPSKNKKKERFARNLTTPCDDPQEDTLNHFTESLKIYVEEVYDITITKFVLQWGINDEFDIPCLIGCEGSKYKFNPSSEKVGTINDYIVLFEALEISKYPLPGKCFTNRPGCVGSELTIIRQKIEITQIRKFLGRFDFDNNEKNQIEKYIQRRISCLCPPLLMSTVPVCKRCFDMYSRMSKSQFQTPPPNALSPTSTNKTTYTHAITRKAPNDETETNISTNNNKSMINRSPTAETNRNVTKRGGANLAPKSTSRTADIYSISPLSRRQEGEQRLMTAATTERLKYMSDNAMGSAKRAKRVYSSAPFPAFLQHS